MEIRKCLFPAAGYGTRFLPATKATPKEMLPILNKPLIQYGVERGTRGWGFPIIGIGLPGKEGKGGANLEGFLLGLFLPFWEVKEGHFPISRGRASQKKASFLIGWILQESILIPIKGLGTILPLINPGNQNTRVWQQGVLREPFGQV